jgi:HAE1 family hydrophobic/amphiphilic exporter-1
VRRLEEHGGSPQEAAIHATSEIALAVLATTCSLVAVFLPVAFMDGIVGRFLASFGLTMSFSILVSMFVAFTLTPMLAARWLKAPKVQHPPPPTPKDVEAPRDENAFYRQVASGAPVLPGETSPWLERVYTRLLAWCLAHRWVVVVLMLATLASIVPLAAATPSAFLPTEDESRLELVVRLPEGTSLAETTRFVQRIADRIDALPEVEQTVLSAGRASGDDSARGANEASVYIGLTPASTRARSQAELVQVIREEVLVQFETMPDGTEIPLLWIAGVDAFGSSGAASAPIQWVMRGADLTRLAERAQALLVEARQIEGTGDHGLTLRADAPERTLRIDRNRARDRAVSTEAIAATLGWLSGDAVLGSIEDVSGSIELRMRPPTAVREQVEEALAVRVAASNGQRVPLGEVVTETRRLIPAAIERTDRERQITLYMSVGPGMSEGAVLEALRAAEARMGVPTEMRGSPAGNARELERTQAAFGWAFLMSIVFMYLVLAAQFESFLVPVVVLVSLPLTVPFALVSLLVMGQSLNLFSALGVLVLFGVVKKNAILQIDHTRHLSAQGWPRPLALLLANRDRLRPILMTTVAFVAGALPLVISAGAGAGANRAIGVVVMGGQSLALLLTLVATPVVGTLIDDAKRLFQRRAQRDENNGEG